MLNKYKIFIIASCFLFIPAVFAADFTKDLSLSESDIRVVPADMLAGDTVKIYATIHNNSSSDLSGVVKFYNDRDGAYIQTDQPVSVLSRKTDDVFVEWTPQSAGDYSIAVRLIPWASEGDDPDNNKVIKKIYVDIDTDKDGKGNRQDNDDDNDGVVDSLDAFPLDPKESKDSDKDGVGDNADTDDDNDGVTDMEDVFPLDPMETKDSDHDKTGDNQDPFPYDASEWADSDHDGLGDNNDPDDQNQGPQPVIYTPKTIVSSNEAVTFNALKSRDPDGEIGKYEWNFGDGREDTGVLTEHIFEKSGTYLVTLKVTDDKGEYREQQIQIQVGWNWFIIAAIGAAVLLFLLLLALLIPGSKIHHKNLRIRWEKRKRKK